MSKIIIKNQTEMDEVSVLTLVQKVIKLKTTKLTRHFLYTLLYDGFIF